MRNNRKKKEEEEGGGTPSWMVTFSDLATLLLTFFVLLLTMSTLDDKTFRSLFRNFTSSCGILNFKEYEEISRPKHTLIEAINETLKDSLMIKRKDELPRDIISEKDEEFLKEMGSALIIENFQNGFKLVFGHQLLFPSGGAEIREEIKPLLGQIATFIRASSYQIYIDGHTDNIPIRSVKYPSNEDLSLARSFNVMNYLVSEEKIPPVSIALAGYGEFQPIDTNKTPAGREKNRRVEIIFKNQKYF